MAIAALGSLKSSGGRVVGHSAVSNHDHGGLAVNLDGQRSKHPHEITLPPISSLLHERRGHSAQEQAFGYGRQQHDGTGSHYAHAHPHEEGTHNSRDYSVTHTNFAASSGSSGAAFPSSSTNVGAPSSSSTSTSNSALTFSPATTPSARTATETSSPSSPVSTRAPYNSSQQHHRFSDPNAIVTRANGPHGEPGPLQDELRGLALNEAEQGEDGFIGRVSQLPYVSGALKVYERGRNSSRVVKYGTDLVESSVKTISKPVISRVVGQNLAGQLDDFACRQLDRFGPTRSGSSPLRSPLKGDDGHSPSSPGEHPHSQASDMDSSSYFPSMEAYYRQSQGASQAMAADGTFDEDDMALSPSLENPTGEALNSHASSSAHHDGH